MKNTFFFSILAILILYLFRKGNDAGKTIGENLNFIESLKKGLQLTIETLNNKIKDAEPIEVNEPGYVGVRPPNEETFSYENGFAFRHKLPRQRGNFHISQLTAN